MNTTSGSARSVAGTSCAMIAWQRIAPLALITACLLVIALDVVECAAIGASPVEQNMSEDDVTLNEPLPVRFTLADGVTVQGRLSAWNAESFTGTFGHRRWTELRYDDLSRVFRIVMNQQSVVDWVTLGRHLLLIAPRDARSAPIAELAFHRARQIDEEQAGALIAAARQEVADALQLAEQVHKAIEAARLRTGSPEADDWPAELWPQLDTEQQAEAFREVRARADSILARAGRRIRPYESEHFLLFSELEAQQSINWIRRLEALYAQMGRHLGFDVRENLFHGKAVVFIWKERDRFRLVEAEAFNQLVTLQQICMTHYEGPAVFINALYEQYDDLFASALLTHTALGILHRYGSPHRLPAWANHGFASLVAMQVLDGSWIEHDLRRRGLRFIREGGNVNAALSVAKYDDDLWPGPDEVVRAVGLLTVQLMLRERPDRFARWVRAIKQGQSWQDALQEQFRTDRQSLVTATLQWYRVND